MRDTLTIKKFVYEMVLSLLSIVFFLYTTFMLITISRGLSQGSLILDVKFIQEIMTLIFGGIGVLLGAIFYLHKRATELSDARRERKRILTERLLKEIISTENHINEELFRDDSEIKNEKVFVLKLDLLLRGITDYIDDNDVLIEMTDNELAIVIKLISFLERNFIENNLDEEKREQTIEKFLSAIQEAKKVCLLKCESIYIV